MVRKIIKKVTKELDPEKLSTKAKNAYDKSKKYIEEAVSDVSLEDIDRAAGRAVDKAGKFAKNDKNSVKSQLAKIKAKDPSERTASEKRLLRLMED